MSEFTFNSLAPKPPEPPSEAVIIAGWSSTAPLVSILCATYQHEAFIGDAIRGFLCQETAFPFEVLIRDDASTDGTGEVIRSFAEEYPRIIKPVFESRNFYPHIRPFPKLLERSVGTFIATCEGDDYWFDREKLELQVQVMLERPEVRLVSCGAVPIQDGRVRGEVEPGGFRTFLFRRADMTSNLMRSLAYAPYGDGVIHKYLTALGQEEIIPRPMAIHRFHSGGMWTGADGHARLVRDCVSDIWAGEAILADLGDQLAYGALLDAAFMRLRAMHPRGGRHFYLDVPLRSAWSRVGRALKRGS